MFRWFYQASILLLSFVAWNSHFLSVVTALSATTTLSPSFLSLPLSRPVPEKAASLQNYVHGPIAQQQHINRAIKRLALMTGGPLPTKYELLWKLHERISLLSVALKRKYELDAIAAILADHYSVDATALTSKPILAALISKSKSSNLASEPYSPAKKGLQLSEHSLHTIGLDIESTDIGYIAKLQLGTPAEDYRVLIDSGSADLWVGAEGCVCDDGGGCGNHTFLGVHSSRTFNRTTEAWAIEYVSGAVAGYIVQDVVSIAGLTLKGHTFGVATNESSDFTGDDIPFDGLVGLGKYDISQQRVPTLLQSLHQAKLIQSTVASYKLSRLADGQKDTGELTLGAMDPKHYEPKTLVKVPNVNKFGFWGVGVSAIGVGKHNMQWNRTIVMDTGTTLIIAPQADVDAIHKRIPGAAYDGSGWRVPCNMTTVISLTIAGQAFTIDPRDIAFYPLDPGSGDCMSGIGVGGVGPFYLSTEWLVGDVFLKNVYFSTNEDNDMVSIAKPKF